MSSASSPTIQVLDQPVAYHRFRYDPGGVLYSQGDKNHFVRLRISNIDLANKSLIVIGGTVSAELYPHPFFLRGLNCSDGVFQLKKDLDSLGGENELQFGLENVSLVRVKFDNLKEAVDRRDKIKFSPFNKEISQLNYSCEHKRELSTVRLAFQVFYESLDGCIRPTNAIAVTDLITQNQLSIFECLPKEVHVNGLARIWIYFDIELPHTRAADYAVKICAADKCFGCPVAAVKKHLIIVTKPEVFDVGNERLSADLVVEDKMNGIDSQCPIVLVSNPTQLWDIWNTPVPDSSQKPLSKRTR